MTSFLKHCTLHNTIVYIECPSHWKTGSFSSMPAVGASGMMGSGNGNGPAPVWSPVVLSTLANIPSPVSPVYSPVSSVLSSSVLYCPVSPVQCPVLICILRPPGLRLPFPTGWMSGMLHYIGHTAHCTLDTAHCILYTRHCTLHTIH